MKKFIALSIILLLGLSSIKAQIYFPSTHLDSIRWAAYDFFLNESSINPIVKADSCYSFALEEYAFGQYDKTRNLCEKATQYAPDWPEPHILTGKAYVSGSKLCYSKDSAKKYLKGEALWVAIDEWEMAIQKEDKSGMALKLIEFYSKYMPDKASFVFCYGESTLTDNTDFFVNCWIQRKTTVRFKEE